jgi:hypothetical protein
LEKKKSNFGKRKKKKGESWKKKVKKKDEKKRNALWITIVIHSALGVGEQ